MPDSKDDFLSFSNVSSRIISNIRDGLAKIKASPWYKRAKQDYAETVEYYKDHLELKPPWEYKNFEYLNPDYKEPRVSEEDYKWWDPYNNSIYRETQEVSKLWAQIPLSERSKRHLSWEKFKKDFETSRLAKWYLKELQEPQEVIDDLFQDADMIKELCKKILANFPDELAKYKAGKTKLLNFFVGQVLKLEKDAKPDVVRETFRVLLK